MRRAMLVALLFLLGAACARQPTALDELSIAIESAAFEVPVGTAFPLTVTRTWARDLQPEAWNDETLTPLVVRLVETSRNEYDDHVVETRSYRAVAAEPGDVRVLPPLLVALREDGEEVVTSGEVFDVRVVAPRVGDAASAVELPGGVLRPRTPWGALSGALGALVIVALLLARARRTTAPESTPPEPAGPPPEPIDVVALRALVVAAERRALHDPRPLCDAVSDAVRTYVRARFGVGAPESSTFELLRDARAADMPGVEALSALLTECELVRFAHHPLDADGRERLLADARELVGATSKGRAA